MYDCLIIGAGMSGLAAGIRCAHFGLRVAILERHTTIGGLNSFYRLAGRNYDVGLHAVTNFTPRGTKKGPLARLLRQLRFSWEDLELAPQLGSAIAFPDCRLRFCNDPALLVEEVAHAFPGEVDGLRRLMADLPDYDDLRPELSTISARARVAEYLRDPLLREMLFCPLMYYGSARAHDMDWGQFAIMFRSVLLEGFARPRDGVRVILKLLTRRFKELGGELRLRTGVSKINLVENRVVGVTLDDGTQLSTKMVLSSAGWHETARLCADIGDGSQVDTRDHSHPLAAGHPGDLTFIESISVLDCQPRDLGYNDTIVFFNDSPIFDYARPLSALADVRSGVICSPNNYAYAEGDLPEGIMRITALANFDHWASLEPAAYAGAKQTWYEQMVASAVRFVPDFRPRVIATDMFTPTTIRRFTGHDNGAVYGLPEKLASGQTPIPGLYVCGTDQGWVGIVGSMVSGIMMANQYALAASG
ncbi:MAG: NAD(P)/FAD-dependent oxidoreductase [Pirellulales bacterium]|nr:NAD(P)/FAD-dependent oxidoreductase [Pirellulales bacterium]